MRAACEAQVDDHPTLSAVPGRHASHGLTRAQKGRAGGDPSREHGLERLCRHAVDATHAACNTPVVDEARQRPELVNRLEQPHHVSFT